MLLIVCLTRYVCSTSIDLICFYLMHCTSSSSVISDIVSVFNHLACAMYLNMRAIHQSFVCRRHNISAKSFILIVNLIFV